MSKQLALDCINLRPTPRWGHTEYSVQSVTPYTTRVTGLPADAPDLIRAFDDLWGIDFLWSSDDGLHGDWLKFGRATDMGHAVYVVDGSDFRQPAVCPFTTPEEVWAFDAVAEYGLPDFQEQVNAYERSWTRRQAENPEQVLTGGYYKTIVSGAIQAFGWDMFLEAAAEQDKIEPVLDSIFRYTLHHMRAWAETSAEVIIQHDDFVWTSGPFMSPDFYRQAIIPRYAELWKPLHAAGKKVLFCSDGTFNMFAEDVAAAGADGFIFEPSNPFEDMVERFGGSHVLIGSAVDCREMTFNPWEDVRQQIDRSLKLAEKCAGLIFAVGNHIPSNVPEPMLDAYINYLLPRLARTAVAR